MQKRIHSLYEACGSTALGLGVSYGASFVVYPLLGMGSNAGTYAMATAIFTVISIVRGYAVRRVGNWMQHKGKDDGQARS